VSLHSGRVGYRVVHLRLPLPSVEPHALRYKCKFSPGVLPRYAPVEITAHVNMEEGMRIFRYKLREPLLCRVTYEYDWYGIECDRLDIVASGATFESAKELFAMKFDDGYYYYNERGDAGLGPRMREIRREINRLVTEMREII
jgi:hypothetical protein